MRTVYRYHTARRRGAKRHHALPVRAGAGQIKLAEHDFINFSPTFLSLCMVVARDVPIGSPLLTCAEPPSLVRTLMPRLVASHDGVQEEGLPVFLTGLHPFYPLRRCCCPLCGWRRRRYCVRVVSGPARCLHTCWRMYPAHHWPQSQLRAVPRGEPIELGHMYNIIVTADDGTVSCYCKEYGYRALVSAQAHLSHAVEVCDTDGGAS